MSSFVPAALVGSVLDGRYRLRAHLASGGMGAIFRAEHVYMRKELALKVLRPELSALPDLAERFRREAEIAASLEHENIVRVTDFGRSPEGWLFLAMELLEGESLFERMRTGPVSPGEALPILAQICEGLEAAHALGVVHRDLKPENVFLCRAPRPWVKLLDFGIAKIAEPVSCCETAAGVVVGTPEYASPEQATGSAVDGRADLYAVGIVAWNLLAGHHPFEAAEDSRRLLMMQATQPVPSLASARPQLAPWPGLVDTVARACAKEPSERFQTAAELRDAFLACLPMSARDAALAPPRGTPLARPQGPQPAIATGSSAVVLRESPPRPRWRSPLVGLAAVCAVAVVVGGAAAVSRREAMATATFRPERSAGAAGAESKDGPATATASVRPERSAGAAGAESKDGPPTSDAAAAADTALREAAAHLAAGNASGARAALRPALARDPEDPRALALLGRALHRIRGEDLNAVLAFEAAARKAGVLDDLALDDLAAMLLGERRVADRAARLLLVEGGPAAPHVAAAAERARGPTRLRALSVLRSLGAEGRLAPVLAYGPLLADADCDVRRQAARRLGEIGDRASLPVLGDLARARREVKGLVFSRLEPVCGAREAEAAVKRIESGRRAASP